MKRVEEVIDVWFDSGSMPFAQWHYPFEDKERIDKNISFPADYICEGIDQTRGWFYTLLAVSTLLGLGPSFRNVVSSGLVLDTNGQKMSKSKGNLVWPKDVIDRYGADAARFYFYTVNPIAEPKRFDFKSLQTVYRKFFDTLNNSQTFFLTYVNEKFQPIKSFKSSNLLDNWIVSRLESLKFQVINNLDNYDIGGGARIFEDFVDDLSNWYIRRSRRRFQRPKNQEEKNEASQTLYCVLLELSKLLAPFCPFVSEKIYQAIGEKKEESVHLEDYPKPRENLIDRKLEEQMKRVREVVALALAERSKIKIRVRQPLKKLEIKEERLNKELVDLIKEEINVKKVVFNKNLGTQVKLDTKITKELEKEMIIREVLRLSKTMRKKANLKPEDMARLFIYDTSSDSIRETLRENKDFIINETGAVRVEIGKEIEGEFDFEEEFEITKGKAKVKIGIKR